MAARVCEYAVPVVAFGRDAVVMLKGAAALTTRLYAFCPIAPLESVAWMVKPEDPVAVGVPLMTPVDGFRVRPGGRPVAKVAVMMTVQV